MKLKYELPAIGTQFGELVVVEHIVGTRGWVLSAVMVQCSCGTSAPFRLRTVELRNGISTCRACSVKNMISANRARNTYREVVADDKVRHSLLGRITGIYQRCHGTHIQYYNYGGRGIKCWWYEKYGQGWKPNIQQSKPSRLDYPIWKQKMLEYLITLPGHDVINNQLDRIDNDRGYEPGNLRFVSSKVNRENVRTVRELQQRINELETYLVHRQRPILIA